MTFNINIHNSIRDSAISAAGSGVKSGNIPAVNNFNIIDESSFNYYIDTKQGKEFLGLLTTFAKNGKTGKPDKFSQNCRLLAKANIHIKLYNADEDKFSAIKNEPLLNTLLNTFNEFFIAELGKSGIDINNGAGIDLLRHILASDMGSDFLPKLEKRFPNLYCLYIDNALEPGNLPVSFTDRACHYKPPLKSPFPINIKTLFGYIFNQYLRSGCVSVDIPDNAPQNIRLACKWAEGTTIKFNSHIITDCSFNIADTTNLNYFLNNKNLSGDFYIYIYYMRGVGPLESERQEQIVLAKGGKLLARFIIIPGPDNLYGEELKKLHAAIVALIDHSSSETLNADNLSPEHKEIIAREINNFIYKYCKFKTYVDSANIENVISHPYSPYKNEIDKMLRKNYPVLYATYKIIGIKALYEQNANIGITFEKLLNRYFLSGCKDMDIPYPPKYIKDVLAWAKGDIKDIASLTKTEHVTDREFNVITENNVDDYFNNKIGKDFILFAAIVTSPLNKGSAPVKQNLLSIDDIFSLNMILKSLEPGGLKISGLHPDLKKTFFDIFNKYHIRRFKYDVYLDASKFQTFYQILYSDAGVKFRDKLETSTVFSPVFSAFEACGFNIEEFYRKDNEYAGLFIKLANHYFASGFDNIAIDMAGIPQITINRLKWDKKKENEQLDNIARKANIPFKSVQITNIAFGMITEENIGWYINHHPAAGVLLNLLKQENLLLWEKIANTEKYTVISDAYFPAGAPGGRLKDFSIESLKLSPEEKETLLLLLNYFHVCVCSYNNYINYSNFDAITETESGKKYLKAFHRRFKTSKLYYAAALKFENTGWDIKKLEKQNKEYADLTLECLNQFFATGFKSIHITNLDPVIKKHLIADEIGYEAIKKVSESYEQISEFSCKELISFEDTFESLKEIPDIPYGAEDLEGYVKKKLKDAREACAQSALVEKFYKENPLFSDIKVFDTPCYITDIEFNIITKETIGKYFNHPKIGVSFKNFLKKHGLLSLWALAQKDGASNDEQLYCVQILIPLFNAFHTANFRYPRYIEIAGMDIIKYLADPSLSSLGITEEEIAKLTRVLFSFQGIHFILKIAGSNDYNYLFRLLKECGFNLQKLQEKDEDSFKLFVFLANIYFASGCVTIDASKNFAVIKSQITALNLKSTNNFEKAKAAKIAKQKETVSKIPNPRMLKDWWDFYAKSLEERYIREYLGYEAENPVETFYGGMENRKQARSDMRYIMAALKGIGGDDLVPAQENGEMIIIPAKGTTGDFLTFDRSAIYKMGYDSNKYIMATDKNTGKIYHFERAKLIEQGKEYENLFHNALTVAKYIFEKGADFVNMPQDIKDMAYKIFKFVRGIGEATTEALQIYFDSSEEVTEWWACVGRYMNASGAAFEANEKFKKKYGDDADCLFNMTRLAFNPAQGKDTSFKPPVIDKKHQFKSDVFSVICRLLLTEEKKLSVPRVKITEDLELDLTPLGINLANLKQTDGKPDIYALKEAILNAKVLCFYDMRSGSYMAINADDPSKDMQPKALVAHVIAQGEALAASKKTYLENVADVWDIRVNEAGGCEAVIGDLAGGVVHGLLIESRIVQLHCAMNPLIAGAFELGLVLNPSAYAKERWNILKEGKFAKITQDVSFNALIPIGVTKKGLHLAQKLGMPKFRVCATLALIIVKGYVYLKLIGENGETLSVIKDPAQIEHILSGAADCRLLPSKVVIDGAKETLAALERGDIPLSLEPKKPPEETQTNRTSSKDTRPPSARAVPVLAGAGPGPGPQVNMPWGGKIGGGGAREAEKGKTPEIPKGPERPEPLRTNAEPDGTGTRAPETKIQPDGKDAALSEETRKEEEALQEFISNGYSSPDKIPRVIGALKSPEAHKRIAAARFLSCYLPPDHMLSAAVDRLISIISGKAEAREHTLAIIALRRILCDVETSKLAECGVKIEEAVLTIAKALENPDIKVQRSALQNLEPFGAAAENAIPFLKTVVENPKTNESIRAEAKETLDHIEECRRQQKTAAQENTGAPKDKAAEKTPETPPVAEPLSLTEKNLREQKDLLIEASKLRFPEKSRLTAKLAFRALLEYYISSGEIPPSTPKHIIEAYKKVVEAIEIMEKRRTSDPAKMFEKVLDFFNKFADSSKDELMGNLDVRDAIYALLVELTQPDSLLYKQDKDTAAKTPVTPEGVPAPVLDNGARKLEVPKGQEQPKPLRNNATENTGGQLSLFGEIDFSEYLTQSEKSEFFGTRTTRDFARAIIKDNNRLLNKVFMTGTEKVTQGRVDYLMELILIENIYRIKGRISRALSSHERNEISASIKSTLDQLLSDLNCFNKTDLLVILRDLRACLNQFEESNDISALKNNLRDLRNAYEITPENIDKIFDNLADYFHNVLGVPKEINLRGHFTAILSEFQARKIDFGEIAQYVKQLKNPMIANKILKEQDNLTFDKLFNYLVFKHHGRGVFEKINLTIESINAKLAESETPIRLEIRDYFFINDLTKLSPQDLDILRTLLYQIFGNTEIAAWLDRFYFADWESPEWSNPYTIKRVRGITNSDNGLNFGSVRVNPFDKTYLFGHRIIFTAVKTENGYKISLERYFSDHGEYNNVIYGGKVMKPSTNLTYDAVFAVCSKTAKIESSINKIKSDLNEFQKSENPDASRLTCEIDNLLANALKIMDSLDKDTYSQYETVILKLVMDYYSEILAKVGVMENSAQKTACLRMVLEKAKGTSPDNASVPEIKKSITALQEKAHDILMDLIDNYKSQHNNAEPPSYDALKITAHNKDKDFKALFAEYLAGEADGQVTRFIETLFKELSDTKNDPVNPEDKTPPPPPSGDVKNNGGGKPEASKTEAPKQPEKRPDTKGEKPLESSIADIKASRKALAEEKAALEKAPKESRLSALNTYFDKCHKLFEKVSKFIDENKQNLTKESRKELEALRERFTADFYIAVLTKLNKNNGPATNELKASLKEHFDEINGSAPLDVRKNKEVQDLLAKIIGKALSAGRDNFTLQKAMETLEDFLALITPKLAPEGVSAPVPDNNTRTPEVPKGPEKPEPLRMDSEKKGGATNTDNIEFIPEDTKKKLISQLQDTRTPLEERQNLLHQTMAKIYKEKIEHKIITLQEKELDLAIKLNPNIIQSAKKELLKYHSEKEINSMPYEQLRDLIREQVFILVGMESDLKEIQEIRTMLRQFQNLYLELIRGLHGKDLNARDIAVDEMILGNVAEAQRKPLREMLLNLHPAIVEKLKNAGILIMSTDCYIIKAYDGAYIPSLKLIVIQSDKLEFFETIQFRKVAYHEILHAIRANRGRFKEAENTYNKIVIIIKMKIDGKLPKSKIFEEVLEKAKNSEKFVEDGDLSEEITAELFGIYNTQEKNKLETQEKDLYPLLKQLNEELAIPEAESDSMRKTPPPAAKDAGKNDVRLAEEAREAELKNRVLTDVKKKILEKLDKYKNPTDLSKISVEFLEEYYGWCEAILRGINVDMPSEFRKFRDAVFESVITVLSEYYKDILRKTRQINNPPELREQSSHIFFDLVQGYGINVLKGKSPSKFYNQARKDASNLYELYKDGRLGKNKYGESVKAVFESLKNGTISVKDPDMITAYILTAIFEDCYWGEFTGYSYSERLRYPYKNGGIKSNFIEFVNELIEEREPKMYNPDDLTSPPKGGAPPAAGQDKKSDQDIPWWKHWFFPMTQAELAVPGVGTVKTGVPPSRESVPLPTWLESTGRPKDDVGPEPPDWWEKGPKPDPLRPKEPARKEKPAKPQHSENAEGSTRLSSKFEEILKLIRGTVGKDNGIGIHYTNLFAYYNDCARFYDNITTAFLNHEITKNEYVELRNELRKHHKEILSRMCRNNYLAELKAQSMALKILELLYKDYFGIDWVKDWNASESIVPVDKKAKTVRRDLLAEKIWTEYHYYENPGSEKPDPNLEIFFKENADFMKSEDPLRDMIFFLFNAFVYNEIKNPELKNMVGSFIRALAGLPDEPNEPDSGETAKIDRTPGPKSPQGQSLGPQETPITIEDGPIGFTPNPKPDWDNVNPGETEDSVYPGLLGPRFGVKKDITTQSLANNLVFVKFTRDEISSLNILQNDFRGDRQTQFVNGILKRAGISQIEFWQNMLDKISEIEKDTTINKSEKEYFAGVYGFKDFEGIQTRIRTRLKNLNEPVKEQSAQNNSAKTKEPFTPPEPLKEAYERLIKNLTVLADKCNVRNFDINTALIYNKDGTIKIREQFAKTYLLGKKIQLNGKEIIINTNLLALLLNEYNNGAAKLPAPPAQQPAQGASTLRTGGVGNVPNDAPKPREQRPYRPQEEPMPAPTERRNIHTPDAPEPGAPEPGAGASGAEARGETKSADETKNTPEKPAEKLPEKPENYIETKDLEEDSGKLPAKERLSVKERVKVININTIKALLLKDRSRPEAAKYLHKNQSRISEKAKDIAGMDDDTLTLYLNEILNDQKFINELKAAKIKKEDITLEKIKDVCKKQPGGRKHDEEGTKVNNINTIKALLLTDGHKSGAVKILNIYVQPISHASLKIAKLDDETLTSYLNEILKDQVFIDKLEAKGVKKEDLTIEKIKKVCGKQPAGRRRVYVGNNDAASPSPKEDKKESPAITAGSPKPVMVKKRPEYPAESTKYDTIDEIKNEENTSKLSAIIKNSENKEQLEAARDNPKTSIEDKILAKKKLADMKLAELKAKASNQKKAEEPIVPPAQPSVQNNVSVQPGGVGYRTNPAPKPTEQRPYRPQEEPMPAPTERRELHTPGAPEPGAGEPGEGPKKRLFEPRKTSEPADADNLPKSKSLAIPERVSKNGYHEALENPELAIAFEKADKANNFTAMIKLADDAIDNKLCSQAAKFSHIISFKIVKEKIFQLGLNDSIELRGEKYLCESLPIDAVLRRNITRLEDVCGEFPDNKIFKDCLQETRTMFEDWLTQQFNDLKADDNFDKMLDFVQELVDIADYESLYFKTAEFCYKLGSKIMAELPPDKIMPNSAEMDALWYLDYVIEDIRICCGFLKGDERYEQCSEYLKKLSAARETWKNKKEKATILPVLAPVPDNSPLQPGMRGVGTEPMTYSPEAPRQNPPPPGVHHISEDGKITDPARTKLGDAKDKLKGKSAMPPRGDRGRFINRGNPPEKPAPVKVKPLVEVKPRVIEDFNAQLESLTKQLDDLKTKPREEIDRAVVKKIYQDFTDLCGTIEAQITKAVLESEKEFKYNPKAAPQKINELSSLNPLIDSLKIFKQKFNSLEIGDRTLNITLLTTSKIGAERLHNKLNLFERLNKRLRDSGVLIIVSEEEAGRPVYLPNIKVIWMPLSKIKTDQFFHEAFHAALADETFKERIAADRGRLESLLNQIEGTDRCDKKLQKVFDEARKREESVQTEEVIATLIQYRCSNRLGELLGEVNKEIYALVEKLTTEFLGWEGVNKLKQGDTDVKKTKTPASAPVKPKHALEVSLDTVLRALVKSEGDREWAIRIIKRKTGKKVAALSIDENVSEFIKNAAPEDIQKTATALKTTVGDLIHACENQNYNAALDAFGKNPELLTPSDMAAKLKEKGVGLAEFHNYLRRLKECGFNFNKNYKLSGNQVNQALKVLDILLFNELEAKYRADWERCGKPPSQLFSEKPPAPKPEIKIEKPPGNVEKPSTLPREELLKILRENPERLSGLIKIEPPPSREELLGILTKHPERFSLDYLKIIHHEYPEQVEALLTEIANAKPGDEILKSFAGTLGAEKTIKKAEGILHFLKEPVEEEKAEPAPKKQLPLSDLDKAGDLIFLGFTTIQAKFLVILKNNKERINNYNYDPVEILEQQQGTAIDLAVETNRIAIQKNLTSIRRKYHDLSFKGKQSVARVLDLDTKTFGKLINYNASTLRAGGISNVPNDAPRPTEKRPYRPQEEPLPAPTERRNIHTPDAPKPDKEPAYKTDDMQKMEAKQEIKTIRGELLKRLSSVNQDVRAVKSKMASLKRKLKSLLSDNQMKNEEKLAALKQEIIKFYADNKIDDLIASFAELELLLNRYLLINCFYYHYQSKFFEIASNFIKNNSDVDNHNKTNHELSCVIRDIQNLYLKTTKKLQKNNADEEMFFFMNSETSKVKLKRLLANLPPKVSEYLNKSGLLIVELNAMKSENGAYFRKTKIILISTNGLNRGTFFHEIFHLLANDIKIKNKLTASNAYKNLEKLILACQKNETDNAYLKNIIQSYEKKLPPDIMPEKFCEHVMCDLFKYYYSDKLTPKTDLVLYNHMKNIAAVIKEACGK